MKTFRIAVIPGDGIGPEVTEVALEVLDEATQKIGQCRLEMVHFPWGSDHTLPDYTTDSLTPTTLLKCASANP
ncbi:MAG: isocitrate/isopropylmalate family dehydrogenase [Limisphaerales bacterium]